MEGGRDVNVTSIKIMQLPGCLLTLPLKLSSKSRTTQTETSTLQSIHMSRSISSALHRGYVCRRAQQKKWASSNLPKQVPIIYVTCVAHQSSLWTCVLPAPAGGYEYRHTHPEGMRARFGAGHMCRGNAVLLVAQLPCARVV